MKRKILINPDVGGQVAPSAAVTTRLASPTTSAQTDVQHAQY